MPIAVLIRWRKIAMKQAEELRAMGGSPVEQLEQHERAQTLDTDAAEVARAIDALWKHYKSNAPRDLRGDSRVTVHADVGRAKQ